MQVMARLTVFYLRDSNDLLIRRPSRGWEGKGSIDLSDFSRFFLESETLVYLNKFGPERENGTPELDKEVNKRVDTSLLSLRTQCLLTLRLLYYDTQRLVSH